MINIPEILHQMTANAEAIRALVQAFPDKHALWKPTPETWAMKDVMEHVYNEERIDFRMHLKEMFGESPQARVYVPVKGCRQALEDFLSERKVSIEWLQALQSPDWEITKQLNFGPNETMTIRADEMLLSWIEHDYLHMRQMVELLHI